MVEVLDAVVAAADSTLWALVKTKEEATGYLKFVYVTASTRRRRVAVVAVPENTRSPVAGNGVVPMEAPPGRCVVVPQLGGGPFHGKLGPTTYRGPSVEDDDELSRCPACNDVLSDGSQCMCSAQ